ncbi:unnamed protein product [Clavelina lepadiformis]|uniref:Suppressor of cytokine signaling 6 n=1 Tax=Clavelina lepadiformis TaxID=159417 RepID=A0ABP0H0M1_CLALP
MKKIRKLSLYKKKTPSTDNGDDTAESENPAKSPVKSAFTHKIRKKFFSGQRSQSLPEEELNVTISSEPEASAGIAVGGSTCNGSNSSVQECHEDVENKSVENGMASHKNVSTNLEQCQERKENSDGCNEGTNVSEDGDFLSRTVPKQINGDQLEASNRATSSRNSRYTRLPKLEMKNRSQFNFNPSTYSTAINAPSPNISDDLQSLTHPVVPRNIPRSTITAEFKRLAQQGWYWGPLSRTEAEEKLFDLPNGSFLVRDSSDERYLLSLSFRSFGRTLHTRIEHSTGKFSFYTSTGAQSYKSVIDLITESVRDSQEAGIFCYSRSRSPQSPTFPVRLTSPVSRLSQVRTLQYLCRFVIRQYTRIDHIEKLPLPNPVKGYLNQSYF